MSISLERMYELSPPNTLHDPLLGTAPLGKHATKRGKIRARRQERKN